MIFSRARILLHGVTAVNDTQDRGAFVAYVQESLEHWADITQQMDNNVVRKM
jgi:hypothetical protein